MEGGVQVELRVCDRSSAEKKLKQKKRLGDQRGASLRASVVSLQGGVEHLHDPP